MESLIIRHAAIAIQESEYMWKAEASDLELRLGT